MCSGVFVSVRSVLALLVLGLCALVLFLVISEYTLLRTSWNHITANSKPGPGTGTGTGQSAVQGSGASACPSIVHGEAQGCPQSLALEVADHDERPPTSVVSDTGSDTGSLSGSGRSELRWPDLSDAPPALQLYLKYHSRQAMHRSVLWSPLVCSHRVILVSCGSGNYGTTMLRMIAALKFAIMTNTTLAIQEAPLYVSIRYLASWRSFEVGRARMGCPIEHLPEKVHYINLENPPHGDIFWTLSHKWKQQNCTHIYYPGASASDRLETERRWSHYYRLRCTDVYAPGTGLLSGQYIRFNMGDQWQALQLLEQNPYYRALNGFVGPGTGTGTGTGTSTGTSTSTATRTGPIVRPYIPDDEPKSVAIIQQLQKTYDFSKYQHRKSLTYFRSCLVCSLFRVMFRVDADVARVIEHLSGSRPFDYFFHIRSVRGGAVEHIQPLVIRQLQHQWATWNRTHTCTVPVSVPGSGPVSVAPPPPPPPPPPHPTRRIYILLDYGNQTQTCQQFQEAVPWLSCHYFSVSSFQSLYPDVLPLSLAPSAVSPSAAGQGWGTAPLWAAVVDMFAVYGAEYGWTHQGSAYGRLVGWNAKDCNTNRIRNYADGGDIQAEPYLEF